MTYDSVFTDDFTELSHFTTFIALLVSCCGTSYQSKREQDYIRKSMDIEKYPELQEHADTWRIHFGQSRRFHERNSCLTPHRRSLHRYASRIRHVQSRHDSHRSCTARGVWNRGPDARFSYNACLPKFQQVEALGANRTSCWCGQGEVAQTRTNDQGKDWDQALMKSIDK